MTDLATVADAVDALTNPIHVREPILYWDENRNRKTRYWTHILPSLLDQLARAAIPGEVFQEDDAGHIRNPARSIPPARLEAINATIQIEVAAVTWMRRAGLHLRDGTARNIRALVGAQLDSDSLADLLADLRRWYGVAATLTGWERPAWRPRAMCPLCEVYGGLRVRLDRSTAVCTNCGEGWDPSTIGLLADHVRQIAEAATSSKKWSGWAHQDVAGVAWTGGSRRV